MTEKETWIRMLASIRTKLRSNIIVVKVIGEKVLDPTTGINLAIVAGDLQGAAERLDAVISDLNELAD